MALELVFFHRGGNVFIRCDDRDWIHVGTEAEFDALDPAGKVRLTRERLRDITDKHVSIPRRTM